MGKSVHTPGPWFARYISEEHSWRIGDGYSEIGMGFGPEDARLIAAAPELLDACRKALSCMSPDDNDITAQALRAAIAKAEASA